MSGRNTRTRNGAIAEYPVEIEAGGKGFTSTRQISSVAGSLSEAISYEMATRSWIMERGNFLLFVMLAHHTKYANSIATCRSDKVSGNMAFSICT